VVTARLAEAAVVDDGKLFLLRPAHALGRRSESLLAPGGRGENGLRAQKGCDRPWCYRKHEPHYQHHRE
jgi:hypothetical protein